MADISFLDSEFMPPVDGSPVAAMRVAGWLAVHDREGYSELIEMATTGYDKVERPVVTLVPPYSGDPDE